MAKNPSNETLEKSDLDTILEVNKKAIELQTENAGQNEDILEKLNEIYDKVDEIDKLQTKVYIYLTVGVVSLILQIIQLLIKH